MVINFSLWVIGSCGKLIERWQFTIAQLTIFQHLNVSVKTFYQLHNSISTIFKTPLKIYNYAQEKKKLSGTVFIALKYP